MTQADDVDADLLAMLDPPDDAPASIALFRDRGLTDQDLDDFGAYALVKATATPFRYFCGCCWRGIKQGWRPPPRKKTVRCSECKIYAVEDGEQWHTAECPRLT